RYRLLASELTHFSRELDSFISDLSGEFDRNLAVLYLPHFHKCQCVSRELRVLELDIPLLTISFSGALRDYLPIVHLKIEPVLLKANLGFKIPLPLTGDVHGRRIQFCHQLLRGKVTDLSIELH